MPVTDTTSELAAVKSRLERAAAELALDAAVNDTCARLGGESADYFHGLRDGAHLGLALVRQVLREIG